MPLNKKMWFAFGFISIAFHIFLIFSGLVPNLISRPIHMALILPWIFLYNKILSKNLISSLVVLVGVFCCLWISFNHEILMDQYLTRLKEKMDLVMIQYLFRIQKKLHLDK